MLKFLNKIGPLKFECKPCSCHYANFKNIRDTKYGSIQLCNILFNKIKNEFRRKYHVHICVKLKLNIDNNSKTTLK